MIIIPKIKHYSWQQKVNYYTSRVGNIKLNKKQRLYADSWLKGFFGNKKDYSYCKEKLSKRRKSKIPFDDWDLMLSARMLGAEEKIKKETY